MTKISLFAIHRNTSIVIVGEIKSIVSIPPFSASTDQQKEQSSVQI